MSSFSPELQLEGKTVIVTGAARGIGEAIARAFGSAGCNVLVADRMRRPDGKQRAESTAQGIEKMGGHAFVMQVDVSDRTQVERMFQFAVEKFGRVDILVNNAAIMKGKSLLDTDEDNIQEHVDVNVIGAFNCCQLAARQMIKQGDGGKIIIISSIDGIEGNDAEISYAMSKAALILMMKCMAVELARHKINVNAIAPGWVATEMNLFARSDELDRELGRRIPAGMAKPEQMPAGMAKPEQMAGPALFLASPLSDYVMGHVLVVDGGLLSNITPVTLMPKL